MLEWLVAILVWLSSDPLEIDRQAPRAAAAVAAARASMVTESPAPAPGPAPRDCACGGTCVNGKWLPDGRVEQACPCPGTCQCKRP
jgi:hypothetical protein